MDRFAGRSNPGETAGWRLIRTIGRSGGSHERLDFHRGVLSIGHGGNGKNNSCRQNNSHQLYASRHSRTPSNVSILDLSPLTTSTLYFLGAAGRLTFFTTTFAGVSVEETWPSADI